MHTAQILEKKEERETAPVAFFSTRSLALDIPMRVEVPLRALIKGCPKLKGTYVVYLHALLSDDGRSYVYYGITKRGWNLRFLEHTKSALQNDTRRLFPQKFNELVSARLAQRSGTVDPRPKLAGLITSICAVGLQEEAAMDVEEYLVDKYSFAQKHELGLNMIPGGREGIHALHRLVGDAHKGLADTEMREAALDTYFKQHPQLGIPKPGVAESWNDPAYAEAVICGRENRLSAEQVRQIRYLAAIGTPVGQIATQVGASNISQVRRVLTGRTYARIG
jgi:hypothetical protein